MTDRPDIEKQAYDARRNRDHLLAGRLFLRAVLQANEEERCQRCSCNMAKHFLLAEEPESICDGLVEIARHYASKDWTPFDETAWEVAARAAVLWRIVDELDAASPELLRKQVSHFFPPIGLSLEDQMKAAETLGRVGEHERAARIYQNVGEETGDQEAFGRAVDEYVAAGSYWAAAGVCERYLNAPERAAALYEKLSFWDQAAAAPCDSGERSVDTGTNAQAAQRVLCRECGKQIEIDSKFCIHCGMCLDTAQAKCSECGTEFPANAKFCKECGQAAEQ